VLTDADILGLPESVRRLVRFACTHMVRSYKPVTLALMVGLADDQGRVGLDALAHQFYGFHPNREILGLSVERRPFALDPPSRGGVGDARSLRVECPIDRFQRAGHLVMLPSGVLRIVPEEAERGLVPEARMLTINCCQRAVSRYCRRLSLDR